MSRSADASLLLAIALLGCGRPVADHLEGNKEVVRRFVSAINERDFDALDDLVAPDLVRHSPSTPDVTVRSLDDFNSFLRRDLESVPDAVQEIRTMVAEDEMVAVWANYAGTQTGPLGPFPASGQSVDLDFAAILRLEGGRIEEIWVVWDNLSMLTELGHLSPPVSPAPEGAQ